MLGYTCANDVSARDWQKEKGGSQWCRGKTFDTFCPLGPWLVTPDEIPNPNALAIRTLLNGETMQDSNTARHDLRRPRADRIPERQHHTPARHRHPDRHAARGGHGPASRPVWLKPGDEVEVEIQNLGSLKNPIEAEEERKEPGL